MNLISEDYLMHHGVKGMKWGVRKTFQARKRWKKATNKSNSKRVESEYEKKIRKLNSLSVYNDGDKPVKGAISEGEFFRRDAAITEKGRKAVLEARLLDSGYSKEEAKIGAEWMTRRQWNLSFSDDAWMYRDR